MILNCGCQVFDLFDTDGGGTIDTQELECAMTALGFHNYSGRSGSNGTSKPGASPSRYRYDVFGGELQEISFDMFMSLMKGELSDRDPLEELRRIFAVLCRPTGHGDDSAAPGEISKARLHRSCKEFDLRLTDEEMNLMLDSIDSNSNQTVDEQEFLAVMSYSAWF